MAGFKSEIIRGKKTERKESKININILERETIETCAIRMGNYMSLDTAKGPKISPNPTLDDPR